MAANTDNRELGTPAEAHRLPEDALTAYLLGEADRNGVDLLDDVDAVNVVEAHLAYFEAIGAVGPQAPLDDVL